MQQQMDQTVQQRGLQLELTGSVLTCGHALVLQGEQHRVSLPLQLHFGHQHGLVPQGQLLCLLGIGGLEVGLLQKSVAFEFGQDLL